MAATKLSRSRVERTPPAAKSPLDKVAPDKLWRKYQIDRSIEIRNYFLERYVPLVRYNAERIWKRLPDEVDVDDLMQAGIFGLRDAIDSFDPDKGVKFETFCAPRINGAILDELRSMDWVPRLVRQRTSKFETARMRIEMETGIPATDDEIARRIGVAGEEFDKVKRDAKPVVTSSINRRCYNADGGTETREIDLAREDTNSDPIGELQRRDLKDLITKGLSRAERLIVVLYYFESMTMKEIGATLDLSESRVSQMHSSILQRLKAQLQHRMRELEPMG